MLFPMQIIVTRELEGRLHVWLKALTRNISRMQVEELLYCCDQMQDDVEYEKAGKIVNLVSDINEEIFKQITARGERMSDKLRYMLLPELRICRKITDAS